MLACSRLGLLCSLFQCLTGHQQQIIHFSIVQAAIHRLVRAEDSFSGKLLRGFQDKIVLLGGRFKANSSKWAFPVVANSKLELWRAKPTGKRVLQTCQKTRRNHSRSRKFSLSSTHHATPLVGVIGSKTVRMQLASAACYYLCLMLGKGKNNS